MDSIVILWQSNMETTHNYIEEEKSFPENDILSNQNSFNNLNSNNRQKNNNPISSNLINDQAHNENSEGTNLYNSNQNLNTDSAVFSNEGFLAELNGKKNQEKTLNYKNKNFPILNFDEEVDPKEHLAENLSKLFEKMVYQLEIVTSSFQKFDSRLGSIEQMIDEIKLDNEILETNQNKSVQQKEIEKEFLNQIDCAKNLKKDLNFIQKNFYNEIDNYRQLIQNQK